MKNATTHNRTLGIIGAIVAWSLLGSSGAVQARPARNAVQIDGPRIKLTDLMGPGAADVDLGAAPPPGYKRRIERRQIERLLSHKRRLPSFFLVQTKQQVVSCTRLSALVKEALQDRLASGLHVQNVHCLRAVTLPAGKIGVSARLQTASRAAGRLAVHLNLRVGTWPPRTLTLNLDVDGTVPVAVAAIDLPAGQPLGTATLNVEHRQASRVPGDTIGSAAAVRGYRLRTALRTGQVLRKSHLERIPVVRRDGPVTVSVIAHGIRITNRGIARHNGAVGDIISVFCPGSRRTIKGRVIGPQQVTIDL